jgi:hypothetical protein
VWESRTGTAHFRGPGAPAKNAALYTVRAQHFPAFKPQSSEQRDLRYPPCSSCHAAEHGMRTRTNPTTPLSRKSASPAPSSRRHGTTRMHKATHEKRPPPRATRNQGTATLRAKRPQVSSMRLLSCGADDSRKHAGVRSPLQAPCACGTGSYISNGLPTHVPASTNPLQVHAPSTDRAPQHSEQRDQWYPLLLLPTCGHGHCGAPHRGPLHCLVHPGNHQVARRERGFGDYDATA